MTKQIRRVLVANRGEIALRVFRTCRDLGIDTVAVFSDADEGAPFVREADLAVRLGPAESAESYLRQDKILAAAKATGADAIHPGYGFLAENAGFARACAEAGVKFIGPSPEAIEAMGLKREAKARAIEAGVPVVPGYDGASQEVADLVAEAKRIGFPVLLKASAGGGGKGMKRVDEESGLEEAIASAKREGEASFGDGTLLIEKYIEAPRHVEIQILGDSHGKVVHLFERECSIQRRHQKILEEAPSPALDEALRTAMGEAAVKLGEAIGYEGAGTVEFILDPDKNFYFLEVNTRLQVEHPVTEEITGVDLVAQQIAVAEGRPLGPELDALSIRGAAIEARLYAEDADGGFLPQSGPVHDWSVVEGPGIRVDTGVEPGSEVSIHYDPMIAKITAWGDDRDTAIRRLSRALRTMQVNGLVTNRAFLLRVLAHPAFVAGDMHTHFIEEHLSGPTEAMSARAIEDAAVLAALAAHDARREGDAFLPGVRPGFRNNRFAPERSRYRAGEVEIEVGYAVARDGAFEGTVGERAFRAVRLSGARFELDGVVREATVTVHGDRTYVTTLDGTLALDIVPRFPSLEAEAPAGACLAPMPGKIIAVRVAVGDTVEAGQTLVVMEAMKMEQSIAAPEAGVVSALPVAEGDQVDADALLVVIGDEE